MGSVMSYSLGLGPDRPAPAGIMAFSGFIPTVDGWQPDLKRDTRVFIAHGRRDPVMDVQFARTARDLLTEGGLDVTYLESDAAHHIDPAHVPAATKWLRATSDHPLPRQ
jgi:phospholipase/carboxylesterase